MSPYFAVIDLLSVCSSEDSDLEDYDHEAAGERIGSMLENLKQRSQLALPFLIQTCARRLC